MHENYSVWCVLVMQTQLSARGGQIHASEAIPSSRTRFLPGQHCHNQCPAAVVPGLLPKHLPRPQNCVWNAGRNLWRVICCNCFLQKWCCLQNWSIFVLLLHLWKAHVNLNMNITRTYAYDIEMHIWQACCVAILLQFVCFWKMMLLAELPHFWNIAASLQFAHAIFIRNITRTYAYDIGKHIWHTCCVAILIDLVGFLKFGF